MGRRSPNWERAWTEEEDRRLIAYIQAHGTDSWPSVPEAAGLHRSDKCCRLRWINYLRPDVNCLGNNQEHANMGEMSAATGPGEFNPTIESLVDNGSYTFSDFIKDSPPTLSWHPPKNSGHLGVFWTKETFSSSIFGSVPENSGAIKEKVKSVLRGIEIFLSGNIFVQFWAATTIKGQCYLTTSDQPFGLRNSTRALCSYRMRSIHRKFNVDVEREEDELGLLGRVFRHELPESTPDVQYYSINEYPQRDCALSCGIRGSFALPVFESSGRCCVGVLEFVDTAENYSLHIEIRRVYKLLEEANLNYPNMHFQFGVQEANLNYPNMHFPFGVQLWNDQEVVESNILPLVDVVCETHKLPFAFMWIPVRHRSALTKEILVSIHARVYDTSNQELWEFRDASCVHFLRRGQGLVGKALLLHKPCFCRDITKLSITNYPLAHHAIKANVNGGFAICLQSTYTGNDDYIVEFFLPPDETHKGDPQTMLDSLLATMKQHSQSIKVRGEELEDKLSVEVFEISRTGQLVSSNICGTTTVSPPRPEALENDGEVVQLDSRDQQLIGAEQNNIAVACLEKTCITKMSEREHRTTKISFSREDLEQYMGSMNLDNAADSLDVSRSSLKRVCRENGIERWPRCKRNKVNHSPSNLNKGNESCRGSEEQVTKSGRKDPSCSHLPPKQVTTVAHIIPPVAQRVEDIRSSQDENFQTDLDSDALTQVVGKGKRGRTRGVGNKVSRTKLKHTCSIVSELELIKYDVTNQNTKIDNMEQNMDAMQDSIKLLLSSVRELLIRTSPAPSSQQFPFSVPGVVYSAPQQIPSMFTNVSQCALVPAHTGIYFIRNLSNNKTIGTGRIEEATLGTIVHNRPLMPAEVKLAVISVHPGCEGEMVHVDHQGNGSTIGDYVGSYVAWPIYFLEKIV